MPGPAFGCGQPLPGAVAGDTAAQTACGCGERQRSSPTGGAANGIPSHCRRSPSESPHTGPRSVDTVVPSAHTGAPASAGVLAASGCAVAVAVPVTAAATATITTPIRHLVTVQAKVDALLKPRTAPPLLQPDT